MEPLWVVIVLLVVAAAGYWQYRMRKARREALSAFARQLGLSFEAGYRTQLPPHGIFQIGHSRKRFNTMTGSVEREGLDLRITMGDYRYSQGHGKNRRTFEMSYAIIELPWMGTPNLLLRREHMLDKVKSAVGFDDIDFESEEFSRKFWVTSREKKFAYDVVHPRMMEFLMLRSPPTVDLRRDEICLSDERSKWDPQEFSQWLAWGGSFLDLWPEHVTERYTPGRRR